MTKNGRGKYEITLRSLVALITIFSVVFALGGAWAGQRSKVGTLEDTSAQHGVQIAGLLEKQNTIDKELYNLCDIVKRLDKLVTKLEDKVDEL